MSTFDQMFESALDKKYSIMQQQATSDRIRADANMIGVQRQFFGDGGGGSSPSTPVDPLQGLREKLLREQIAETRSATGLNTANADATSSLDLRSKKAFQSEPSGTLTVDDVNAGQAVKKTQSFLDQLGGLFGAAKGTAMVPKSAAKPIPKGFAKIAAVGPGKGTAKVPGKGSGKVDKVPAVLAPGEAVLNKGAAQIAGRGLIAHLNKVGARKMGMV